MLLDPKKVEAIKRMQAPQTKQGLQSFFRYGELSRSVHQRHVPANKQHEAITQEKCFVSVDRKP